jgi:hypothetical protein
LKKTKLVLFSVTLVVALAMVLAGCTPTPATTTTPKPAATVTVTATPTTPAASATDKKYNDLNPRGIPQPVNIVGLAPRLTTLDGKKIYVVQGEADPVVMPALNDRIKADYPKANIIYYQPQSSFGPNAPDATTLADANAVIRGVGW